MPNLRKKAEMARNVSQPELVKYIAGVAPGPLTFQIFGTASAGVPGWLTTSAVGEVATKTPALKIGYVTPK